MNETEQIKKEKVGAIELSTYVDASLNSPDTLMGTAKDESKTAKKGAQVLSAAEDLPREQAAGTEDSAQALEGRQAAVLLPNDDAQGSEKAAENTSEPAQKEILAQATPIDASQTPKDEDAAPKKPAKKAAAKKAKAKAKPPVNVPPLPPSLSDSPYLPEPGGSRAVAIKHGHNVILLPYIILKRSGWQGVTRSIVGKSIASRLIWATVLLPGLFIFLYLLFFASNCYISEAKFAVRGQESSSSLDGFSNLFSLPASTQKDSYIVLNYIMSYDMFAKLDASLHLREHFSDTKHDIWFRLSKNATQDDLLRYWQWVCESTYDPDTSILEVQVKAFTPEMALAICQQVLKSSEQLVNDMNTRSRQDAIAKAEAEVLRAETRIRNAREAMREYRENTVILDPEAVASGLYSLVNKLEADVTQTTAELSEAQTYMKKDSPRVKQLQNRLLVLQKQLAQEKKRLAGKVKGDQSLSSLLSEFQKLTLEEEFAQKQLTSAMTSLETAKVQADAQTQYVEAFERPILADESLYPRPVLFTFLYMITALLLLGLLSLIVAAVREHAGF